MVYLDNTELLTDSKVLFSGEFPKNGTMYENLERDFLNLYSKFCIVLEGYVLNTLDFKETALQLSTEVYKKKNIKNKIQHKDTYITSVIARTRKEFIELYKEPHGLVSTIAGLIDDEILLCRVKGFKNKYCILHYSIKESESKLLIFETDDSIDIIKNNLKEYLEYDYNFDIISQRTYRGRVKG